MGISSSLLFKNFVDNMTPYEYIKICLSIHLLMNIWDFPDLDFCFVHNPIYDKTNYIKSIDLIADINDLIAD